MKIGETTLAKDCGFIKLFSRAFEHNGKGGQWVFATRDKTPVPRSHEEKMLKPDAVIIMALVMDGEEAKIVLTSEFRVPIGTREIGFPAGLIDEGETAEDAARRELTEETGLEIERIESISPPCLYSSAGLSNETAQIVICDAKGIPNTSGNEQTEDIQVLILSLEETIELMSRQDLAFSAKTWCLLYGYCQMMSMARMAREVWEREKEEAVAEAYRAGLASPRTPTPIRRCQ